MKRYKISVDGGEYRDSTESALPLYVRETIETFISAGRDSGMIEFPGCRYEFSVCPEQCFPEDIISDIHRICCEIRTMVETLSEIDAEQFRQTIAVLRSSSTMMTTMAIREGQKIRDELNSESECDF